LYIAGKDGNRHKIPFSCDDGQDCTKNESNPEGLAESARGEFVEEVIWGVYLRPLDESPLLGQGAQEVHYQTRK
jgi:hypothetical protein